MNGGGNRKGAKDVAYFCETNEQVNAAERKRKGRRQHTNVGGKEGMMLSRKKWEIYSTVPQNPARAEPNGFLPRHSLVLFRAGNI